MHDLVRTSDDECTDMRNFLELLKQPVFTVDRSSGRIVDANRAGCEMLAATRGELIGRRWTSTARRVGETSVCYLDAERRRFVAVAHPPTVHRFDGPAGGSDALTGLANREALGAWIASDADNAPHARLALLFIDLDGFKQVNDTWGHVAGDGVLRVVAQRLVENVRPGDLVVRYGGDEFLVVVRDVSRLRDLERLARRIARAVSRPIGVEDSEVALSASIGIARRKSAESTLEMLIAEADRAMYRAKAEYRSAVPAMLTRRAASECHTV